jgi:hypothetical protein
MSIFLKSFHTLRGECICLHEWLCGARAVGVTPACILCSAVMCIVLLSASVVWKSVC